VSFVELVPAFVADDAEGGIAADVIGDAGILEAIGAGFDFEINGCVFAGEDFGKFLPLLSLGEKVDGQFELRFDNFWQLTNPGTRESISGSSSVVYTS